MTTSKSFSKIYKIPRNPLVLLTVYFFTLWLVCVKSKAYWSSQLRRKTLDSNSSWTCCEMDISCFNIWSAHSLQLFLHQQFWTHIATSLNIWEILLNKNMHKITMLNNQDINRIMRPLCYKTEISFQSIKLNTLLQIIMLSYQIPFFVVHCSREIILFS